MSDEYQFTKDWFAQAEGLWPQLIPLLPARKAFLEIGSFEGRSMAWIVENMLEDDGILDCVDTWEGGEEHSAEDMQAVRDRFEHNRGVATRKHPEREVVAWTGTSIEVLGSMCQSTHQYDFVYIDGSHIAKDVLTDACMSWALLKPGGLLVFDDYMWGSPRDILHRPKIAIDAFCNVFAEEVEVVHVGYQMVVRKKDV